MALDEPPVPCEIPPLLTAGTSFKVDRSFADYPNAQWKYTLLLAGAFTAHKDATADADGRTFHVVWLPADTQPLNPSGGVLLPYQYTERLTALDSSGEVFDVGGGVIKVEPNAALMAPGDGVSWEERTLAVLRAKLQGRVSDDIENYSIAGRSISKIPLRELVELEALFARKCWKLAHPGLFSSAVEVVFPPTSWGPTPKRWRA